MLWTISNGIVKNAQKNPILESATVSVFGILRRFLGRYVYMDCRRQRSPTKGVTQHLLEEELKLGLGSRGWSFIFIGRVEKTVNQQGCDCP